MSKFIHIDKEMNTEDAIELAVACGLIGFLLLWYVVFFVLLVKSSKTQMVKSKSPKLLLMSTIGNFMSFLTLSITLILIILENEHPLDEKNIRGIANIGLILTETIFAPLMLYSHMFRIVQLKNIFEISNDVDENTRTKSKWFRQEVYFIFALLLFAGTIAFGIWLAVQYSDINNLFPDELLMVLMSLSFVFIFPVSIFGATLISSVKYFTEVRAELTSLVSIWTILNGVFYFIVLYFDVDMNNRLHTVSIPLIILLVRNMMSYIVVLVIPLLDRNKEKVIPFGETQDSISNLGMIVASELCFKYFFDFIAVLDKTNGANITALYIQMRLYEEIVDDNLDVLMGREKLNEIIKDFLTEGGKHYISNIPSEVKEDLEERVASSRLDAKLLGALYNNILPRLQKYFEAFQEADLYKTLRKELKRNEIVYERLVNGNLI